MRKLIASAWLATMVALSLWAAAMIIDLEKGVSELDVASSELLYNVTLLELAIKEKEAEILKHKQIIQCEEEDELED